MRIYLKTTGTNNIVPYDHLPSLVGVIHKWLGKNNSQHGKMSLYSFSWLQGARGSDGGLVFPHGARFFISAHEESLIKQIIDQARHDPDLFMDMRIREISIQDTPNFSRDTEQFTVSSPVLIKRMDGNNVEHLIYNDAASNKALTDTMIKKMDMANINSNGLSISFDPNYRSARTKLVNYNGIHNKASFCPIVVKGTPEQIAFVWNVGVGNSTGIGFGSIN